MSSKQNNTTSPNSSKLASNQYVAGHAVANNLKPTVATQRTGQQPIFHEYWSAEHVSAALEAGAVLKVCEISSAPEMVYPGFTSDKCVQLRRSIH
jgi:hypothetical protein